MENPYKKMREEVIQMQRWFAINHPRPVSPKQKKRDPDIEAAVDALAQTRKTLEQLWVKTSRSS